MISNSLKLALKRQKDIILIYNSHNANNKLYILLDIIKYLIKKNKKGVFVTSTPYENPELINIIQTSYYNNIDTYTRFARTLNNSLTNKVFDNNFSDFIIVEYSSESKFALNDRRFDCIQKVIIIDNDKYPDVLLNTFLKPYIITLTNKKHCKNKGLIK